jgi:hypothetical protein
LNSDQDRLNQYLEAIVETNFINPPVIRIAIVKAKKLTSEEQKEAVPQDWNWTLDSHDLVKDLECKLTVAINEDLRQREEENKEKFDNMQKQKDEEKNRNKRYREQERIRNEINSTVSSRRSSYSPPSYSPPSYSPPIKGPYTYGIYWTRSRNRAEHNNHPLSKLLYKNKRYYSGRQLTEEEISEICNPMYNKLETVVSLDEIEIIVPVPNDPEGDRPEPRCAPPIATGLAAMICKRRNRKNCNSYNDVLVKDTKTIKENTRTGRRKAAENNYDVTEDIKTAENSTIKDQIVLLIDDITTSGSTAEKCANLLISYRAKQVIILCAAETKLG